MSPTGDVGNYIMGECDMGRYESRPTGAMVSRIDAEALTGLVRQTMAVLYGTDEAHWGDYTVDGVFLGQGFDRESERIGWFIVGTEGVGHWFNFNNLATVTAVNGWGTPIGIPVSLARLQGMKQEDVDLVDVVRVFGDRLESNFSIWYSAVSEADRRKQDA